MIAVIDAGNTRLKWATVDGGRLVAADSVVHATDLDAALDRLVVTLPSGVERILVANVAGARVADALSMRLRIRGLPAPEFAAVEGEAHGLRCAYAEPHRLGVDRWVAAIAGYALVRDAVAIIDAGTTVTLDVIDAGGRHLGGLIFAGPGLAARALHGGTQGIGPTALVGGPPRGLALLGRGTDEAVGHAAMLGVAAGLERALDTVAEALGRRPTVLLTGGDAPLLRDWLETDVQLRADLVLEGLAFMAAKE